MTDADFTLFINAHGTLIGVVAAFAAAVVIAFLFWNKEGSAA